MFLQTYAVHFQLFVNHLQDLAINSAMLDITLRDGLRGVPAWCLKHERPGCDAEALRCL